MPGKGRKNPSVNLLVTLLLIQPRTLLASSAATANTLMRWKFPAGNAQRGRMMERRCEPIPAAAGTPALRAESCWLSVATQTHSMSLDILLQPFGCTQGTAPHYRSFKLELEYQKLRVLVIRRKIHISFLRKSRPIYFTSINLKRKEGEKRLYSHSS